MNLTSQSFATELRGEIARKQLTSGDLATILKVSPSTVSRLINGEKSWTLDQALTASKWAGLSIYDFLGESA